MPTWYARVAFLSADFGPGRSKAGMRNGRPIGGIAQCALRDGPVGLPLAFLSGGNGSCRGGSVLLSQARAV